MEETYTTTKNQRTELKRTSEVRTTYIQRFLRDLVGCVSSHLTNVKYMHTTRFHFNVYIYYNIFIIFIITCMPTELYIF